jgi:periplasmic divalent cation tolerance protein
MLESSTSIRIVLTTAPSREEAHTLARALVEERLAACASILPQAHSIYHWEGKIEEAEETVLLLKTVAEKLAALESRLLALHSYSTPEFLVLSVSAGSGGYLDWIGNSLKP